MGGKRVKQPGVGPGGQMSYMDQDGKLLRDEGMERVASHSGLWKDRARAAMDAWFARLGPGQAFTGEDIRLAIREVVGEPHHPNAWGAVTGGRVRGWLLNAEIELVAVVEAKDPKNHATRLRRYRKRGGGT